MGTTIECIMLFIPMSFTRQQARDDPGWEWLPQFSQPSSGAISGSAAAIRLKSLGPSESVWLDGRKRGVRRGRATQRHRASPACLVEAENGHDDRMYHAFDRNII